MYKCIAHIMKMSRTKFKFKVTVLRQSWVCSGEDAPHLTLVNPNSSGLHKPDTNPTILKNRLLIQPESNKEIHKDCV